MLSSVTAAAGRLEQTPAVGRACSQVILSEIHPNGSCHFTEKTIHQ
jgi:hypothetical protein